MAKAKYLADVDNNKIYPVGHTRAVYDDNGTLLEERLKSNEQNIATEAAERQNADNTKVDINGGDVSKTVVSFTQSDTRTDISSGETVSTLFGKIKKWFADLKTVAWTGDYSDLSNKPSLAPSNAERNIIVGIQKNGADITPDSSTRKVNITVPITASDIGAASSSHTHTKANITDFPTSMTPTSHASTGTTYGKGDSSNYGHLKLSDSTSSSSGTSSGTAATPAAVKAAYDLANGKANASHSHSISDITSLQTTLNGKASSSHSHSISSVTGLQDALNNKARTATLVVAASNSSTKSKSAADYTCSGSGDQSTINSAISALPTGGGKVLLLEGTYNISGSINVNKANVTIEGMGASTVLKRMFNGDVIGVTANDVTLKSFKVDGNKASFPQSSNRAVALSESCLRGTLNNLYISNDATGVLLSYVKYFVVEGCNITGCTTGILCDGAKENTIIANNILNSTDKGITAYWNAQKNTIANNFIDTASTGIYLENTNVSDWNKVLNNTILDATTGIKVMSSNNYISGNYIMRGTGQSSDYTASQYTILISGTNNVVSDNYIYGKNYVNNGGSTNVFNNNIWDGSNSSNNFSGTGSGSFIAGGSGCTASGTQSFATGYASAASGGLSFAAGSSNTAKGNISFVFGLENTVLEEQAKFGHHATDGTAGTSEGTTGDAFFIGNGTNVTKSNAFRVTYSGNVYGKASFHSTGADYAEFFEWLDGNPDDSDRTGLFVTLDGDRIRLANADDDYILGIVSAAPGMIGNDHADTWQGMWLTDIFGRVLTQTVHHEAQHDYEGNLIHDAYDAVEPIVNPDYNPDEKYVPREERKEWGIVGMMGQLVVIDDGTCKVNGCCTVSDGGTATASDSGYRVIARLDDTHVKVLFR